MSPEYGATIAICPIDDMTLDYLRLTGRDDASIRLVEAYAKEQGLFRTDDSSSDPVYTSTVELDLSTVEPSLAGPKRPQDRVSLRQAKVKFEQALEVMLTERKPKVARSRASGERRVERSGRGHSCGGGAQGSKDSATARSWWRRSRAARTRRTRAS